MVHFLSAQRRHILGAMEGLTDGQLRRPVLPSGWSCLGLLKHLEVSIHAGHLDAVRELIDGRQWVVQ